MTVQLLYIQTWWTDW